MALYEPFLRLCTLHKLVHSASWLYLVKLWASVSISGLVILVDEAQNIIFGQFLRIHPCLRIMDYHPVHPGPEEPLRVANTEDMDKGRTPVIHQIIAAAIIY